MLPQEKQVVTKMAGNMGTASVNCPDFPNITRDEVINILKDIEGIKRRLLKSLQP